MHFVTDNQNFLALKAGIMVLIESQDLQNCQIAALSNKLDDSTKKWWKIKSNNKMTHLGFLNQFKQVSN